MDSSASRAGWSLGTVLLVLSARTAPGADIAPLPPDWFARYAAEQLAPAKFTGPVEEKWRIADPSTPRVLLHQRRVTFVRRSPISEYFNAGKSLKAVFQEWSASAPQSLVCLDIGTGEQLWAHEFSKDAQERPGHPVSFDRYLLVKVTTGQPSSRSATKPAGDPPSASRPVQSEVIWLLDAETGRILKRFGPEPLDHAKLLRRFGIPTSRPASADPFAEAFLQQLRYAKSLIGSTYLAPKGPVIGVSADMAGWTFHDAETVLDVLGNLHVSLQGVGWTASRDRVFEVINDREVVFTYVGDLRRQDMDTGHVRWSTPLSVLDQVLPSLLWHPPLVMARSGRSQVTAFDAETGEPRWHFAWPHPLETERYTFDMAALEDGFLLLTDPVLARPYTTHKDPVTGGTSVQFHDRLCLIKLGRDGRRVFWQELDITDSHRGFVVEDDHLVVYSTSGDLVGFGPASRPQEVLLPDEVMTPEFQHAQKIANLHARFEAATIQERKLICAQLGQLGDQDILGKVLAAYDEAGAQDRVYYLHMVRDLRDQRAVPWLIDRLDDPDPVVLDLTTAALQSLTGERFHDPSRWKVWWRQQHPTGNRP